MKKIIAVFLALILGCAALGTASAAADETLYLRLFGIDGAARDAAHNKWIDVVDYTVKTDDDGNVNGLTFTHRIDPATTGILQAYINRVWLREGRMEVCRRAAGRQYVVRTIQIEKLRITDVKVFEMADGSIAETVTLTAETGSIADTPLEFPYA